MKKQLIIIVSVFFSIVVCAQKKPKIDGNKIVTEVYDTLGDFNGIEISDDLQVTISQSPENGYHLKTDENLVDVIRFDIINGVLKIHSTHKITKSKELFIALTVIDVDQITLRGNARLTATGKLNLNMLSFTAFDDSTYELDMKVDKTTFNLNKNCKGKLKLKGKKITMVLNENALLKGDLVAENLDVTINKRSDLSLSGDVDYLKLTATGTSDIKAKKLKASYADLNASNAADIYINATKELKVYTKGKSNVYVYGNPEVKVDGLNDKSKIIKK